MRFDLATLVKAAQAVGDVWKKSQEPVTDQYGHKVHPITGAREVDPKCSVCNEHLNRS